MTLRDVWRRVVTFWTQPHGPVKSFEQEVEAAPGLAGRVEGGMRTVPTHKIVGSVGRAQNLRSDFFYRTGKAMTARFVGIGKAMEQGKVLPPIEVYKAKLRRRRGQTEADVSEYYVVDGHHRVAMAKKLGQDYLDAHVVEYKVAAPPAGATPAPHSVTPPPQSPPPQSPPPQSPPPDAPQRGTPAG